MGLLEIANPTPAQDKNFFICSKCNSDEYIIDTRKINLDHARITKCKVEASVGIKFHDLT
jgi:hypothetical protein